MWDDKTPAANEESWDIKGGGGETGPVAQQTTADSFIYTNSSAVDGNSSLKPQTGRNNI